MESHYNTPQLVHEGRNNLIHKTHNAPLPYPMMHHSEQKCAHFCFEWCIMGSGLLPSGNKPLPEPALTKIHVVIYGVIKPQWVKHNTLRWRHNGGDGVSNHQAHHCLLNCIFRRRSKKTSKLRVTGLCAGNSLGTGEFPAQMASNAENVSIWSCHHDTFHSYNSQASYIVLIVKSIFPKTDCDNTWLHFPLTPTSKKNRRLWVINSAGMLLFQII